MRQLSRRPLTTLVVVGTLALGIGANTAMFTLLDVALFRRAPFADASRLAWIVPMDEQGRVQNLSYPEFAAFRERANGFSGVLAFTHAQVSLGGGSAERVWSQVVSANAFEVLGVIAQRGRTFEVSEERPGAPLVVVISDGLWHRRYQADPAIIGAPVVVNGRSFVVIGVTPPGFNGPELLEEDAIGMWFPTSAVAAVVPGEGESLLANPQAHWLQAIGRRSPGVTQEQAQAHVETVAAAIPRSSSERQRFLVEPVSGGLDPSNRRDAAPVLGILAIVPVLVLLVACANVANVLLARGIDRRRELAMRRALGATRARLVRQLLTEYALLALPAAAVAVAFSYLLIAAVAGITHMPASMAAVLTPDARVLAATTTLAVLAVLVFGLAPALAASRPALTPALKDDGVSIVVASRRHRLRGAFLVVQVTISMVLVGIAGLFLGSLSKVIRVDPGFETRRALTMSVDLGLQGYNRDAQASFIGRALENVTAVPGVERAAFTTVLPLGGRFYGTGVSKESDPNGDSEIRTGFAAVSPGYFDVMQMPVVAGRALSERDDRSAPIVAVVNETLAGRLWPGEPPIGKRVRVGGSSQPLREVVGVVRDSKYDDLTESPRAFTYLPLAQDSQGYVSLVVRTAGDERAVLRPVQEVIQRLDADLPVFNVRTFDEILAGNVDKRRAASVPIGVFGVLTLLLASLGLYGVTAHDVTLRTREIGIRMSLGARRPQVVRLFVRQGLVMTLAGLVGGIAISLAASRLFESYLFGLDGKDATTLAASAAVLAGVAVLACYLPARRATRVDPLQALRAD
jgi:putative ABC transport system permease protein